jgi:YgiT-type zinc finger domain-containing protein
MSMNHKLQIKLCPTCGSDQIKPVLRDLIRNFKGQSYTVPQVAFYDCPNCGEKIFDHEAMLKIETCSPAYHKVDTMVDA